MSQNKRWVVLKFGGTSVSSKAKWEAISEIVKERLDEGVSPFIVCSAFSGISDELERLLDAALSDNWKEVLSRIEERHKEVLSDLGVPYDDISCYMDCLSRLITGASLVGEISPRLKAQVMSVGELISTKAGSLFLKNKGVNAVWKDAREMLAAADIKGVNVVRSYLHAVCECDVDQGLSEGLLSENASVIVTQGFIARDVSGDTVLLGRGGSDVSAAYFAAKLAAERCEIWTDVPGMYTANPHKIPSARLIKSLDYDEAQEIALSGAKVLHPRCIKPLIKTKIPLHIKWMERPQMKGTTIAKDAEMTGPQVKGISSRGGITLVSMETVNMWHQAGFLADAFACFKKYGLSIDLVSTSETSVTVSLDRAVNLFDGRTIDLLLSDLNTFCDACAVHDTAIVSLVGKNIRAIMHQLGSALEVFEEQKIYLVSQAANDLNLTFVVDADQAERLVQNLHREIFGSRKEDALLGLTWKDLFEEEKREKLDLPVLWWKSRRSELLDLASKSSPVFAYDCRTIDDKLKALASIKSADRIFYSIKANPNPEVLKRVYEAGFGFECVSIDEVNHLFAEIKSIDPKRVIFTPNFAGREEYEEGFKRDVHVTLDNIHPLEYWPEIFVGKDIFVRMDPGRGRGHHKYVHTAGTKSKFGVPSTQIDQFATLVEKASTRVIGLHAHVGSNIFQPDTWSEAAMYLAQVAERFPDVKYIDMGGGLGVVEKPGQGALDMASVNEYLAKIKEAHPNYELWLEPGRFIIAEAGVLLARVTQTKTKGDYYYVGINAGMNNLIRPALYGSYHEIVNLSRLDEEPNTVANIVGPICESGDVLGYARHIPTPTEGDVMLIATTGAYGKVMSSSYNLRKPAEEVFLK